MSYVINKIPFDEIEILTTTRQGGFSEIPYDSFNMSYGVGDDPKNVLKNRELFIKELGIVPANLIIPKQLDGQNIIKLDSIIDGREGDAFYTYNKDLVLSIIHSNCVPIFLYVPNKGIIAAIHSSIKGSFLEITRQTIKTLIHKENVKPEEIYAFFGPGIAFSHINITEKELKKAENIGYLCCVKVESGIMHLDVNLMNFLQLRKEGVPSDHIILSKYDTYENANLFYSSMRNNPTGRMLSIIRFKKN
jgi:YfiH family protein